MNNLTTKPNDGTFMQIVSLRLAVGLLGEREAAGWWASSFMSPTSTAFLAPAFGSRVLQARYQGVVEAARRLHDERIGVGRAFHPFRLPEVMEQRLFEVVQSAGEEMAGSVDSLDAAEATLERLVGRSTEAKAGPALVGTVDMLDESGWISVAASLYSSAFGAGIQCFPYFTRSR
jgi:hypothetical protein